MGKLIADQKIVLVTGKGGVGKSTIATLIAKSLSSMGKTVILVELSEVSKLDKVLGIPIEYKPSPIAKNAWVSLFRGESCLREFITHYIRIETIVNLFFDNKVMKALIKAAPALRELAILGKVTSGVRGIGPDFEYDFVVVDGYATGHFQSLLKAPKAMGEIIDLGPMGEQSRGIDRTLKDPQITTVINVTLAEELPMTESVEFIEELTDLGFPRPRVVINKWQDLPATKGNSQQVKDGSFLEYLSMLSERQKKAEDLFGKAVAAHVPFDFSLNLKNPADQTLLSVEDLCKSFLKSTK